MATETRVIRIQVDSNRAARQLRNMDRNLEKTRRSAQGLEASFTKLNRVFGVLALAGAGGGAIRGLVRTVDQYKELTARVELVAAATVGAEVAMMDLADAARTTYTSLEGAASLYSRLGLATRELGTSHESILGIVTLVADTLRLSGASAKESAAFMTQFSQAMASNRFAGDEFRSMLETNVYMSLLLADALGTTIGGLRKMAEEGELTRKVVIGGLEPAMEDVRKEAERLPVTMGRAWENMKTSSTELLAALENLLPLFQLLASTLNGIATTIGLIARGAQVVGNWVGVTDLSNFEALTEDRLELLEKISALEKDIEADSGSITEDFFGGRDQQVLKNYKAELADIEAQLKQMRDLRYSRTYRDPSDLLTPPSTELGKVTKLPTLELVREEPIELYSKELDAYAESLGKISDQEVLLAEKTKILIATFNTGTISVEDYRKEFEKLYPEIDLAADSADKAVGWADALSVALGQTLASATSTAADAIVDFAIRAEGSFSDTAQSILESIAKMIIQMALMRSLFGATGTGGLIGGFFPQATGNAFQGGNVVPFANGGVVNTPTLFPMANGTGIMGEAGAEAILPLSRGKDGKLGVSGGGQVVNIINNSSEQVTQEQSTGPNGEEMINVFIGAVANDIATGGATAQAVEQSYGMRRAGNMR